MLTEKKRNRDLLALLVLGLITLLIPIVFAVYYSHQVAADKQSISENKLEIKRLDRARRKKQAVIYQRQENIASLNERMQHDTNILIASQMILSAPNRTNVTPIKLDQAERDFTGVVTTDLSLANDRMFYLGKTKFTLKASYPTQFQLKQSQIPIVIHAYDQNQHELAFDVLGYDADQHKFNTLTAYSVTYPLKKNQPTDYKSYLKQQKQAKLAQEKADRQSRQKAHHALKKQKATHKTKKGR